MKQLSAAKGYVAPINELPTQPEPIQDTSEQPPPKNMMHGPLGDDLKLPATALAEHLARKQSSSSFSAERKAKVVSVTRPTDVEEARLMLPITAKEQPIMEAILLHSVVTICGEIGSGKATQAPQFLHEAGFGDPTEDNPGMIGVTQPRRVAAISMATRAAHELSLTSSRVSYQIRYDATVSPLTTIKFMTDGILLRDLAVDFLLLKYSVISLSTKLTKLGVGSQDLALDVDDGVPEEDPEALDSVDEDTANDLEESDSPMHVVPLYSLLPSDKQMQVFESPPPGCRLVVVSTNVAETSLMIPRIRYVVDCGRAKERRCDATSCIQSFQVNWISKASAAQRAGRTSPGHCYGLYSSTLYEHYFESFSQPELLRTPIEGVVLQMKSMGIDTVVNFPFPTPPDTQAFRRAETVLTHLGAVSSIPLASSATSEVSIATIGGMITIIPPYVITIISIVTMGDPFLHEEGLGEGDNSDDENNVELDYIKSERVKTKEIRRTRREAFFETQQTHTSLGRSTSDIFRILSVVGAYEFAGGGFKFCSEHFVRPKAMEEIRKLRAQICNIMNATFPGMETGLTNTSYMTLKNALQLKVLRQLLAAAFIDQVAVQKDLVQKKLATGVQYSTANSVPYRATGVQEDVFIHPSSVLSQNSPPDYIVFTEIVRTTKPWLKGVTLINSAWLSTLGKPTLWTFTKHAKNSAGVLMTIPKFGPDQWELPPIKASVGCLNHMGPLALADRPS
ncbi:P-loop containing nucleoside triphosphate hydrolase protein [Lanmaoa asiatica]|nr:P-loop containing nucleoside triphosphate hydrolase protein [Lanmaoa asiatica]